MNILIIQGPNLNLIGLSSAKIGEKVTLDKVNQGLRKQAHKRPEEIKLKTNPKFKFSTKLPDGPYNVL